MKHVKFLLTGVAMALVMNVFHGSAAAICFSVSENETTADMVAVDDDDDANTTIVERVKSASGNVTVVAPALLLQRALPQQGEVAEKVETPNASVSENKVEEEDQVIRTKNGKVVGFRVQVYADNNVRTAKAEARQRERAVEQSFPDYDTYVSYASPYWRLRVGDFKSQYEAEKAAAEIRKTFPHYAKEVRVVRDRVNIR